MSSSYAQQLFAVDPETGEATVIDLGGDLIGGADGLVSGSHSKPSNDSITHFFLTGMRCSKSLNNHGGSSARERKATPFVWAAADDCSTVVYKNRVAFVA